ncbi:DUF3299 domain-containing protein [Massilia sp. 9096]|uniref:DUF3299 domain-containing protein n=1 Tax=Massilia sp. 9096 TaxID=1500894 RepID=UPI00056BFBE2|nr:DUF3299 domain-containing protein [Massilia sp. 9096]
MKPFLIRSAAIAMAALAFNLAHAQQHPQNAAVPVLKDIPGVLPWSQLENVDSYKAKDGRLLPKYPDKVLALDNQKVQLQGFMMPLEPGIKQSHFLLTVTTPSCPYCLPAGPEGIVEIKANAPVKFTYTAMILTGQMHVLKSDPAGLYYRLTDATPVVP